MTPTAIGRVVVVGMLLFATTTTSGCSDTDPDLSPDPSTSAVVLSTSDETQGVSADLLDQVDRARSAEEDSAGDRMVTSGPARPSVIVEGGERRTMVIHDQSNMRLGSGSYTLTVYCAGTGVVVAAITFDGVTKLGGQQQCGASGLSVDETVVIQREAATQMDVSVIPVGETAAAIGYVVVRG